MTSTLILPRVSEFIKLTMLSVLLNPVTLVCLCFCPLDLALLSLLGLRGASDRGMCRSKGGNQRKAFLPSANNFMVTHPGQTIIDKNIVSSTSKDGVIRYPACEEEYCDTPTEEWIQCCKCQE
ncbi:hypothetical protein TNCV_4074211 [Trichonephila clavipes]|uniref:Uncharacterized protein n=1 Tax=Trichonephila clavipes TaxID=2585209 RepID=A0A8X7BGB7_TRICX|nr:hypothetical protein TNCV_4074211 [Trichonephila clavipes]